MPRWKVLSNLSWWRVIYQRPMGKIYSKSEVSNITSLIIKYYSSMYCIIVGSYFCLERRYFTVRYSQKLPTVHYFIQFFQGCKIYLRIFH